MMKFKFPRRVFPALGLILLISGLIASVIAVLRSTELRRRATEPENRLVGEWKFDEGTGGTVADSGGNERSDLNPRAYSWQDEDTINQLLSFSPNVIQQQIDSLPASGGEVFLPAGTYVLDTASGNVETFPDGSPIPSAVVINKNNVVLRGAGSQTILQLAPGVKMRAISITAPNVTIKDLVIDGNKNQRDGSVPWPGGDVVDALLYGNANAINVTIENVESRNGIEDGIGFWKNRNVTVKNSYSHDNGTPTAGGAGISLSGAIESTAINNRVENNTATGIWSSFDANNITIAHNTITNNHSGGITIGGGTPDIGLGPNNSGFNIFRNILSQNGSAGFATITLFASADGHVKQNRIDSSHFDSFQIDGTDQYFTRNWTISQNVCPTGNPADPGIRNLGHSQDINLYSNLCPANTPQLSFPGDLNLNQNVDIFDYNQLVADFGKTTTTTADIDRNGKWIFSTIIS